MMIRKGIKEILIYIYAFETYFLGQGMFLHQSCLPLVVAI